MFPIQKVPMSRSRRIVSLALLATTAAITIAACGSSSGSKQLSLVAYSTPKSAYDALTKAFEATPAGKGWTFQESFGASGAQAESILAGAPADVAALSLDPDIAKLVKGGLVPSTWNAGSTKGEVSDTVAVLIVRPGNPKHITGWDDLAKPGIKIVTPSPVSSGSARWNIMAAYGAELKEGKTPAQAEAYLTKLFKNTVSQDSSARNAEQTFLSGTGDVLLDYENEAISLKKAGEKIQEVVPSSTILIQNPAAVISRGGHSAEAQKFVSWLSTPAAQAIFVSQGFRPTISGVPGASQFPKIPGLFTIDSLGGWTAVSSKFFDPTNGIVTKIEQNLGNSG
jgi:sulfate/thiosulfate-binding protein